MQACLHFKQMVCPFNSGIQNHTTNPQGDARKASEDGPCLKLTLSDLKMLLFGGAHVRTSHRSIYAHIYIYIFTYSIYSIDSVYMCIYIWGDLHLYSLYSTAWHVFHMAGCLIFTHSDILWQVQVAGWYPTLPGRASAIQDNFSSWKHNIPGHTRINR
jgi:hypothetical protein